MKTSHEKPITMHALEPETSLPSHSDWDVWSIRILLWVLVLSGVISVLAPGLFSRLQIAIGFIQIVLIGFGILALVFYLYLASQRKLLRKISKALIAATSYIERLESFSFVDPETQLFNRRYLDQLFNQHLGRLNRCGKSATLLLFEVLPNGNKTVAEEMVIEAALILRANFRGSDYVLRNSADQFLVLLPDTTEDQTQYALNRLADKVDSWNLENETSEMALRHELSTCPPGGNLWESLNQVENKLRENNNPDHGSNWTRAFSLRA